MITKERMEIHEQFGTDHSALVGEIERLRAENARLRDENEMLNGRIPTHLAPMRILAMLAEIERLRAMLANTSTSCAELADENLALINERDRLREALEQIRNRSANETVPGSMIASIASAALAGGTGGTPK